MRRIPEPADVIDTVAQTVGIPVRVVADRIRVFRDCIDELLTGGWSLVTRPLMLAMTSDPVAQRFADRYGEATEEQLDAVAFGDRDTVARWLEVDPGVYDRHPIADEFVLLARALDRLGVDEKRQLAQAESVWATLTAWLDTFAGARRYKLSTVGLECDLERWLVGNLEVLAERGFEVTLERQQWILADRRRPDLVCRFAGAGGFAEVGDWLVIELKAGAAYLEAVDQLAGYVAAVRAEIAGPGEEVFGLLVADGISAPVREHLDRNELDYLSLSAIGYREAVAGPIPPGAALPA